MIVYNMVGNMLKLARKMIQSVDGDVAKMKAMQQIAHGDVDTEIFAGESPAFGVPASSYMNTLRADEEQYINNILPHLLRLQRIHGYNKEHLLHSSVWSYIYKHRLLGLNIPTEYGGANLSPAGISVLISKIASAGFMSLAIPITLSANAGISTLLTKFGTTSQKRSWLTRLAEGMVFPCATITGPKVGNEHLHLVDTAINNGDGTYTVELNTTNVPMAAKAAVFAIAINIPGHGITVFIIDKRREGIQITPSNQSSEVAANLLWGDISGTIHLTDADIIGGPKYLGKGWHVLTSSLSRGRATSLPAMSSGAVAAAALMTGAAITQRCDPQGVPIYKTSGVHEAMAEIAYQNFMMFSMQTSINAILNTDASIGALGAVWKYQSIKRGKSALDAAIELTGVLSDAGPYRSLLEMYYSVPLAASLDGANSTARALDMHIHSAVASHKYVSKILDAIDRKQRLRLVWTVTQFMGNFTKNTLLTLITGNRARLYSVLCDLLIVHGAANYKNEFVLHRMADIFSIRAFDSMLTTPMFEMFAPAPMLRYARKRLHIDESRLYHEMYRDLPWYTRFCMRPLMIVAFSRQRAITSSDNKSAAMMLVANDSQWVQLMSNFVEKQLDLDSVVSAFTSKELLDTNYQTTHIKMTNNNKE